jgi:hypothetical protein
MILHLILQTHKLPDLLTSMIEMEAACFSETLVYTQNNTRRSNHEYNYLSAKNITKVLKMTGFWETASSQKAVIFILAAVRT